MKISELSKKTGVSQRMLRYFEQEGLLDPLRSAADYREYESSDEEQVLEIREWQRLGLTLKEVKKLKSEPVSIDQVLEPVLYREREAFIQKERALRELRRRLLGRKSPYFPFRVAHPIPHVEKVLCHMENLGWKKAGFSYFLFSAWRDEAKVGIAMFGEIILRSAFYLLVADAAGQAPALDRLMSDFCDAARSQWANFDGCPPTEIAGADLGDFFGPHDIVFCLKFDSERDKNLTILLPYQAIFALAKGAFADSSFLK
jgi:DNA-binding transcriptional MerR regulator